MASSQGAGAAPALHNLPLANPAFQSRPALMQRISDTLGTARCAVISGAGGMGKSQLAKHYAHGALASGACAGI